MNPFSQESREGVSGTNQSFLTNAGKTFTDPFKEQSLRDTAHIKRDFFTGGGNIRFDGKGGIEDVSDVPRSMEYYEDVTYDVGGIMSIPGLDSLTGKLAGRDSKTTGAYTTGVQGGETTDEKRARKSGANTTTKTKAREPGGKLGGYAHAAMLGADASRMIRTGDFGREPDGDLMRPDKFLQGGGSPVGNRILRSGDALGTILSGQPLGITEIPGLKEVSKDEGTPLLSGIAKRFGSVKRFFSLSEFEKKSESVRSQPGIQILESDRYYTVMYHPLTDVTYIEWKPTVDIKKLSSKTRDVGREWGEDFIAALGMRIPAWSKRVKYIKEKYGMESAKVKHYGYSRGGGIATHMGGLGFGTGYFSSYLPHTGYRSKMSGDKMHDYIINPLSYALMLRNILA